MEQEGNPISGFDWDRVSEWTLIKVCVSINKEAETPAEGWRIGAHCVQHRSLTAFHPSATR